MFIRPGPASGGGSHAMARSALAKIVGRNAAITAVHDLVAQAAPTSLGVLILGESGTGKELVASAIATLSDRRGPYVSINCAAISREVAESELFGHERGAFTGAAASRQGLFEEAHGGTLFLDEVGDLPSGLQPKLLRVLETGKLRRVGGRGEISVDVRILAATQRLGPQQMRLDLYHRLAQIVITLPPLRERLDDLPLLCHAILGDLPDGGSTMALPPAVMMKLRTYDWPGNVRELRNVLLRARMLGGPHFGPEHIWFDEGIRYRMEPLIPARLCDPSQGAQGAQAAPKAQASDALGSKRIHLEALVGRLTLERMQEEAMSIALARSHGNRRRAAALLGIPRTTLGERLRRTRAKKTGPP